MTEGIEQNVDIGDNSGPEVEQEPQKQNTGTASLNDQHYRLAGRPPLKTILLLAIGPIIAQFSSALYGIVDTVWVGRTVGPDGITAIATYGSFDGMSRAFGFFVAVAGSSKISQLFGKGKGEECAQVFCDLLRVAVICGAVVSAVLIPTCKSCARWFGAPDDIIEKGYGYIVVILGCSVSTAVYYASGGCLQGEGRSLLFGIMNMSSMFLNMGVFDPLFLMGIKLGVKGAAVGTVLSEFIPSMILLFCYFSGKFSVKPKLSQLCKPFSPHTFPALRVGLSQLVAQMSIIIPNIFIIYFIAQSTDNDEDYNGALAGCNIAFRWAVIVLSIVIAFNMAFLPPASYAYARGDFERWKWLLIHAAWINFVWSSLTATIALLFPRQVSSIFSSDSSFLDWAAPMMRNGNALGYITWVKNNAQSCLQSLQKGVMATVLALGTQLLALLGGAILLYYTDKHNPTRLQWAFPISFAFGVVVSMFVLPKPILNVIRGIHEEDGTELQDLGNDKKSENTGSADEQPMPESPPDSGPYADEDVKLPEL